MSLVDVDGLLADFEELNFVIEEISSLLQNRDRDLTELILNEDNFTLILNREERIDFLCMLRDNYKERQALLGEILFDAGVLN